MPLVFMEARNLVQWLALDDGGSALAGARPSGDGADMIDGQPAIVSKALDEGQVVLFNWSPMHRHVNHHDHAFVYNTILNWNDL